MKSKLLKNEEDILFDAWTLTLFLIFSQRWCLTEVVSSRSNTYYCWSLSDDRCLFPALRHELMLSITFKATDSPERLSSKIHPRYFTFACCLISIPLYTVFKDLAFQRLCSVQNNIDFILSCPKCILNLLSTNQSH